jgi:hypothetical protein
MAEPSSAHSALLGSNAHLPLDDNDPHMNFPFGGMGNGMQDDFDLLHLLANNILPFSESVQASPRFLDSIGLGGAAVSSMTTMPSMYLPNLPDASAAWASTIPPPSSTNAGPKQTTWHAGTPTPAGSMTTTASQKEDAFAGSAVRSQEALTEAHSLILDMVGTILVCCIIPLPWLT